MANHPHPAGSGPRLPTAQSFRGAGDMTVVEFLEARITEDEALANIAASELAGTEWHAYSDETTVLASGVPVAETETPEYAPHIARHDPARVLAECKAKRAILADRKRIDRSANPDEWSMGYSDANYGAIQALAAVYKDHPDYDAGWK